jgi:hypothetical protein
MYSTVRAINEGAAQELIEARFLRQPELRVYQDGKRQRFGQMTRLFRFFLRVFETGALTRHFLFIEPEAAMVPGRATRCKEKRPILPRWMPIWVTPRRAGRPVSPPSAAERLPAGAPTQHPPFPGGRIEHVVRLVGTPNSAEPAAAEHGAGTGERPSTTGDPPTRRPARGESCLPRSTGRSSAGCRSVRPRHHD